MRYVLFVCTHNAGRSQMAQAFFERHGPPDIRAESAGQEPAEAVWPEVVEAMAEVGIDLSQRRPKKLTVEMQLHADWAITLACAPSARSCRRRWRTGMCPTRRVARSRRCGRHATRSRDGSRRCWPSSIRQEGPPLTQSHA